MTICGDARHRAVVGLDIPDVVLGEQYAILAADAFGGIVQAGCAGRRHAVRHNRSSRCGAAEVFETSDWRPLTFKTAVMTYRRFSQSDYYTPLSVRRVPVVQTAPAVPDGFSRLRVADPPAP